jgi:hypothetical protein
MDTVTQTPTRRIRRSIRVVGIILAVVGASWCAWQMLSILVGPGPRVKVDDVERSIRESLAKDSSREDVVSWIRGQALIDGHNDEYENYKGQRGIEAWILNTTPMVDIRILFFFDANDRLAEFKVKKEGRFSTRNDD